jgi:integrase/recombinase XerD
MEVAGLMAELATPQLKLKSLPDVPQLIKEFEHDCLVRHLTPETIGRYKSALKIFNEFLRANGRLISQVDKYILKDFIYYRREQGIDQKTLENNFTALSTFYEFLCFEGYANVNPVLPVRKRYLRTYKEEQFDSFDESKRKLATIEQMSVLVNSILNTRDQAVVLLLAKTGLRRSELVSIDIDEDIDWVEQSITLKRKKFKKRSGRTVFFDGEMAVVLKRWESQRKKLRPKTKALFVNEYNERLGRNGVYNLVTKYAEAVGLHNPKSDRIEDHFSSHNCRHWFTTWLRRSGMPREFIKALRGDRRKDAIDIYDHIDREELRKAYLAYIPQLGIE